MNVDHLAQRHEDQVGGPRKIAAVKSVPVPERVYETTDQHLWLRIFAAYAAHIQLALRRRENVHHL
jgi:hypothetical protein